MTRRLPDRTRPVRQFLAIPLLLLVGVGAAMHPARAGLISTSLGNIPMDEPSSWRADVSMHTFEGDESASLTGDASASRTFVLPGPTYAQNTVTIDHVIGSNLAGAVSLSSAAWVRGSLVYGDMQVGARGASTARLNDIVYVQNFGGAPLSGYIRFDWRLDGTLRDEFRSTAGVEFVGNNGLSIASLSMAEVFVNWIDPYTHIQSGSSAQRVRSTFIPYDGDPQDPHWYAESAWPGSGGRLAPASLVSSGRVEWRQSEIVDREESFTDAMAMLAGMPVPISLSLMTAYNTTWRLEDVGDVEIGTFADFSHTAVLAGVNFFNPDGSPYIGEWQLVSANGYDYPEVVVAGQASTGVSAPAPLGLAAAGLLGLIWRGRRRPAAAQQSKSRQPSK